MSLDVKLIRESVHWSPSAATAFRHGLHDLEDHLVGLGIDRSALEVRMRSESGEADIHAVLRVGDVRLDANAEDPDLPLALARLFEQLQQDASVERLANALGTAAPIEDGPWEEVYARLVAAAHHMVTRVVDLGDLPAGVVEATDLADDALVGVLEDEVIGSPDRPSFRELRALVAALLSRRIEEYRGRLDDVELDGQVIARPNDAGDDDEMFEYLQPDDAGPRREDLMSEEGEIDDADRGLPIER